MPIDDRFQGGLKTHLATDRTGDFPVLCNSPTAKWESTDISEVSCIICLKLARG